MRHSTVFIDTWGWLTLAHRREPRYQEVTRLYKELSRQKTPMYTSDYVLAEFINLLFRRVDYAEAVRFTEGVLAVDKQAIVQIERITASRFAAAWELRKRFQDKPNISFTDLTSMIIMKELQIQHVLTEDEHFMHVGMGYTLIPQRRKK